MNVRPSRLASLVAVAAAAALAGTAGATIVGTTGDAQQIAPPASVEVDALESNTTMFTFDKQQCTSVRADLPVDVTVPGTYDDFADLTPGTVAAGTQISSHFIHTDPVDKTKAFFDGTVTVDK